MIASTASAARLTDARSRTSPSTIVPGSAAARGASREHHRLVPGGVQRPDDGSAKISGSAGDENTHAGTIVICFLRMFKRQRTGSVVCPCGSLVGVNDEQCYTCGRRNPGLWGYASMLRVLGDDIGFFVTLILYGCSILYMLGLLLTTAGASTSWAAAIRLRAVARTAGELLLGASGAAPVFQYGMWWTVLSAGWLHGGVLHMVFNMMVVRQLAPAAADIYGAPRMVIIYSLGSIGGFLLSSFAGLFGIPLFGAHADTRRVGADFRAARRADVLRPPRRQQHRALRGDGLRARALRVRPASCRASTTPRTPAASSAATSPACGSIR